MKKIYNNPTITVYNIKPEEMICLGTGSVSAETASEDGWILNSKSGTTALDFEDDEDED